MFESFVPTAPPPANSAFYCIEEGGPDIDDVKTEIVIWCVSWLKITAPVVAAKSLREEAL
jgi:hypothetical protein